MVKLSDWRKWWEDDGFKMVLLKEVEKENELWTLFSINLPYSAQDYGRHMGALCVIDKKTKEIARAPDGAPRARTSHTLNPVPCTIFDPSFRGEWELDPTVERRGLSNVSATALFLLGYEAPEGYDPALIRPR